MRVYLIRHGQSTADIDRRFGGAYDDHLSKKGQAQAAKLTKQLSNEDIVHIFASKKNRALETAGKLSKKLGIRIVAFHDIVEWNRYGVLSGLNNKEAKKKYPLEYSMFRHGEYEHIKGAEKYTSFKKRVLKCFSNILSSHHKGNIAIICHGGPIKLFMKYFVKIKKPKKIGDCAYAVLERHGDRYKIIDSKGIIY